jgi:diguanylate cyclase (GGDEF)-like protein
MFYFLILLIIFVIVLEIISTLRKVRSYQERIYNLKAEEDDLKGRLRIVNERFGQLEEIVRDSFFMYELAGKISPILDREELLRVFKEEINTLEAIKEVEFFREKQAGYLNFRLETHPPSFVGIKSESKRIKENLNTIVKEINLCLERIDLYEKLESLSIHDSLTGIHNRRYFVTRFFEEFERAKKFDLNLSLLMVDIDHFKKVNDTYGHLVGDVVLKEVSVALKSNLRQIDFIARYGGEEFIIILHETDKKEAIFVGERLKDKVASTQIKAFDEVLNVTVSIGVASFPENSPQPDVLMELADKALYKAKQKGRNRVESV